MEGVLWKDWTVIIVDDRFAPPGAKQAMAQNTIIDKHHTAEAVFFDIVMFGPMAEDAVNITQKGDIVVVKGIMTARRWIDKRTGKRRGRNVLLVKFLHKGKLTTKEDDFAPVELFKFDE